MAVVARMLRGEPLELVARETNVSIGKLTEWRELALAGAATALKERERDDRDDEIARLKSKVGNGQRAALRQDRGAGGQTPFGPQEVETMSQALSPSFACCYGLARVARVWKISRQRLSLSQRDAAEHERPSPWSAQRMFGRGTGRCGRSAPTPHRSKSQAVGSPASGVLGLGDASFRQNRSDLID